MANQVLLELESAAQIMLVRNIVQRRLRYVKVRMKLASPPRLFEVIHHYNHATNYFSDY
jgi:hypothetical protein